MCVGKCLQLLVTIINVILGVFFLAIALIGILIKTSPTALKGVFKLAFGKIAEDEELANAYSTYLAPNTDVFCAILVGFGVLGAIMCAIGAVASSCVLSILLKIYAAVLGVLIVAEVAVIIYVFAVPDNLVEIVKALLMHLAGRFAGDDLQGKLATVMWELVSISNDSYCCGWTDVNDFPSTKPAYPFGCCHTLAALPSVKDTTYEPCVVEVTPANPACSVKVEDFLTNEKYFLWFPCIIFLVPQVVLFILSILSVCIPI